MSLTPEQQANLKDPFWRLNNLYTIIDKETGLEVIFTMNRQQRRFFKSHHFRNAILKARQLGFSTLIELILLDAALFYPNTSCGVIADTLDNAQKLFRDKLRAVYDKLPEAIKQIAGGITKATETELYFGNGSSIRVGTSLRGSTLHYLHISEFGKIAANAPHKAREIITGAFNAMSPNSTIFVESTAEGQSGAFYDMVEAARKHERRGKTLSEKEFKFFFYPWWEDKNYVASTNDVDFTPEDLSYFLKLQNDYQITLTPEQKAWWALTYREQREDMGREFPSHPDEAFETPIEGAYYGPYLEKIERAGQVKQVPYDPRHDVETAWDIGMNDSTAIIFFQRINNQIHIINYYEDEGKTLKFYAEILRDFSREYGYAYSQHNMPHDIRNRDISAEDGDRKKIAERYGIKPINVVTKFDINTGIDKARLLLSTCFFDEQRCDDNNNGKIGLLTALRNYRKEYNKKLGRYMDTPRHDKFSHAADAFRYLACSEPPVDAADYQSGPFRFVY